MTTTQNDLPIAGKLQVGVTDSTRTRSGGAGDQAKRGQWWRFLAVFIITAIVVTPIVSVLILSLQPGTGSHATGLTLSNFSYVFKETQLSYWLLNREIPRRRAS